MLFRSKPQTPNPIRYSVDVDMFSCCKAKDPETKIVLLGLDRSGKTSLLKCIAGEDINKVVPTCGFNIRNYEMNKVILNIWDIGGMYMESQRRKSSALILEHILR